MTGEDNRRSGRMPRTALQLSWPAGHEIKYNEAIAPTQGVRYGGRIAPLPGQSPAEELATLIHEIGHELLHCGDRRATTTRTVRELEAEAVAFVAGHAV